MNPYKLTIEETTHFFQTNPDGLKKAQAEILLQRYGLNRLAERKQKTALQIFFKQFLDFMILVLIAAAIISGLLGDKTDTLVILIIVILNAAVGFFQEFRAERAMEALKKMVAEKALVIREGIVQTVAADHLVPGDVVLLEAGNIIPADIRLTETIAFHTQEASLTGESHPIFKETAPIKEDLLPIGDQNNMAFKGTIAASGRAKGIVVATGMQTEIGKISNLLQIEEVKTPIQKRLIDFGKKLSIIILLICLVIFIIGLLRGEEILVMLLTSISLAIAAIPEALPAVITIALALGAKRMAKKFTLIRNLPAVETLGSVTWICTDKTGTLTLNQMQVQEIYDGKRQIKREEMDFQKAEKSPNLLFAAMALSNNVAVSERGNLLGDPTEVAFYEMAASLGFSKNEWENQLPRVAEIPFDSDRKLMSTIHQSEKSFIVLVKGAVDVMLQQVDIPAKEKQSWYFAAENMSAKGLRVLGFATKRLEEWPDPWQDSEVESGLTMLGLVGLIDPPREEVKAAIAECKTAGVRPVMITGDHALTATSIARQLGIIENEKDLVITGQELGQMDQEAFLEKVEQIKVYARVSPQQKLFIVQALQQKGEIVAMTGDGVNDAPSLKRADVGVAMGITGTDVSKEASDMILLDDNFATIVTAIKEGRRIFDNIKKFIRYTMTSNAGEIWTILLAPFFGLPIPLLPIHILWINLVTDGLPGLALAAEKAEPDVMRRPPRHPRESIFAGGLGIHILWVGFLMGAVSVASQAFSIYKGIENWQTIVFTVLCLSQMGHVFAIRSEKRYLFRQGLFSNTQLLGAVLLTFALQMAVVYVPALNSIFKTAPLSLEELLLTLGFSIIVFHAVELEKWIHNRMQK